MKRVGFIFLLTVVVGGGLGACSTAMEATSALADRDVLSLKSDITPEEERSRIFEALGKIKLTHHSDAIKEIESR